MKLALLVAVAALAGAGATPRVGLSDEDRALIDAQSALVEAAVEAMPPQRPGTVDVYFVGFAGYGGQRVFRKEATFARDAFARRYGDGERSLLLVNDERDRGSHPLATRTNLRQALRLVGERMDREEDLLILLLTSHGSAEEGLEVTNGDLPLAKLAPADLSDALEQSGIRWRVVIASACFAGVFIPPLKDAFTLVATAADARHSSFGCEDERELTWFGEALLRDALPRAPSIEQAFFDARATIERRERAARVERSRPQIHVGRKIRAKLVALDAARPQAGSPSVGRVD